VKFGRIVLQANTGQFDATLLRLRPWRHFTWNIAIWWVNMKRLSCSDCSVSCLCSSVREFLIY